jgi:carboxylesterase
MSVGFDHGGSFAGKDAAVVVVHGVTGSPASFIPQVDALIAEGFRVEVPLLPGHGTTVDELAETRFDDWWREASSAIERVIGEGLPTFVMGLSMGGTLTLKAGVTFETLKGLILINPAIEPPAASFFELARSLVEGGNKFLPAVGSDIKNEGVSEPSYPETPIEAAISLFESLDTIVEGLPSIKVPALLFNSLEDHVVPTSTSDFLLSKYGAKIERIWLKDSFHVATVDNDSEFLTEKSIGWIRANL